MHLFLYMILRSDELPMIPTTKMRQDTMVFTYLKAYLISVRFLHMGGKEPRGRTGCKGGRDSEALFAEGSDTSEMAWESRMKRDAPTSTASRRQNRAVALILAQVLHSGVFHTYVLTLKLLLIQACSSCIKSRRMSCYRCLIMTFGNEPKTKA